MRIDISVNFDRFLNIRKIIFLCTKIRSIEEILYELLYVSSIIQEGELPPLYRATVYVSPSMLKALRTYFNSNFFRVGIFEDFICIKDAIDSSCLIVLAFYQEAN